MTEKSWFILRYNHFPPSGPSATIKLGQIVSNPTEPYLPIDFSGPLSFPPTMPSITSTEEKLHWDNTSGTDVSGSVSAQIQGFPVSGSISAEFKNSRRDYADFDTLETNLIIPTPGYVNDSMERPVVREFLGKNVFPKSVYMITGMKIARGGGTRGEEQSKTRGGGLQLGVTPTPAVPISLGPDLQVTVTEERKVSAEVKKDFVWAFSLRQVHYRRGVAGKHETYRNGATLEERIESEQDSGEDSGLEFEEEAVDPQSFTFEVDGIDPVDFTGEGSELVKVEAKRSVEDGQIFLMVDKL